ARTTSWRRCGFTSAPKTSAVSVTSLAFVPVPSRRGAFGATIYLPLVLSHDDDRVLVPWDRALHEQEVLLGIAVDHGKPDLGRGLRSHLPGHAPALEHAGGRGRGAHRTGSTDVVRAVARRTAVEAVALSRALEPFADRDSGDLDLLPGLE